MTSDERKNFEFAVSSSETNLRYLLGEIPHNETLIDETKKEIAWRNEQLKNNKIDLTTRQPYTILKT